MKSKNWVFLFLFILSSFQVLAQKSSGLQRVFNSYMELKDALVATNSEQASLLAKNLGDQISIVKTSELNTDANAVWSTLVSQLKQDASAIHATTDINAQRVNFITLSNNMLSLIKAAKMEAPVYLQYCPMANKGKGASWLSLENKVKNPYYGNKMLSCGKVVETIQ